MPDLREAVRAKIGDAYYDARNAGDTMETAADNAADVVFAVVKAALLSDETVEAAALRFAGKPRCFCPDDPRQPYDPLLCPQHGQAGWPCDHHYRQSRAALTAAWESMTEGGE